jgi:hypothetical protein
LAARCAAMGAGHVRLGPGLVDEHETRRIKLTLMPPPSRPLACDIGPILLAGVQAFF